MAQFVVSLGTIVAVSALASRTGGQLVSTFDANNEAWASVQFSHTAHAVNPTSGSLSHDAVGGNPGGAVRLGDVFANTGIKAPASWLGDRHAYYGGSIQYDIKVARADSATYAAVGLNAGTFTLKFGLPSPPVGVWSTQVVPLTEVGWAVNNISGVAATQAQMIQALTTCTGIYIRTEWFTGAADDTFVDNIRLIPPHCPADLDNDGVFTNGGSPDGGVDIGDLLYFLAGFESGSIAVDLDNDGDPVVGLPDGGVDIADLLYFLAHFEAGC